MIVKSNTTIHEYTSKGGTLTSAWYPIPSTCTYVQPSTYVTKLGYQTLSNTLPTKECWHTGGKYDHLRSQHSLPWRSCFAFGSLPTYLLVTKQCVNNIACVQQSDQSWSNTHHDWSDIVVTRCILEYYKQCVNHCLRLNTFCLDLSCANLLAQPETPFGYFSSSRSNQICLDRQLIMTTVTSDRTMWWFVLIWAVQSFDSTRDIFCLVSLTSNQICLGRQLIMTKVTSWQHDVYLDCQNRSRWIQWNR